MWKALHGAILLALLVTSEAKQDVQRVSVSVTPIEKVITLLKDLEVTVEKEGTKEAEQYDKFACFCKNQAKFKKEAIDRSKEKIDVLKADIKDLTAEIKDLSSDISTLTKDITKLETDIKKAKEDRAKEHKEYLAEAKDVQEAIDACDLAVEHLKNSKKKMTGAKLDLSQLKMAALQVQATLSPDTLRAAMTLVRQAQDDAQDVTNPKHRIALASEEQAPPKYEYQSNDIIATIEKLGTSFKKKLKDLDKTEFDAMDKHEKQVLGWSNEKTFKEKEKKEKQMLVEAKTEEKSDAEKAKTDEEAAKKSDEEFVKTLKSSCEQKAKDWDQRSKARSQEMTALAEAVQTLEKGALGNYNANKKLVGLLDSAEEAVKKVQIQSTETKAPKALSFLQVRNVQSAQAAALKRVLQHLDDTATRLRSPVLSAVALKVVLKEDHFVKVRGLIKDLITKLKADAKAEATTKSFCDKEMKKAVDNRDKGNLQIEEQNGIIAKKTSLAEEKKEEIEELGKEIAELHKAILDAEKLRKEEKASNAQTVEDAKAGEKAVQSALTVLKGFYAFAQNQVDYKPPNSDREGKTVGDRAPEAFEGEYKGKTSAATGIIGILEVIQSDFARTKDETEKAETKAAKDHTKFVTDTKKDITSKETSKKDATTDMNDAKQAIVKAKDDLYDAKKLRTDAEAELDKLAPMCVEGEETWEERKAKREQEIESLKEAMKILDDWQN